MYLSRLELDPRDRAVRHDLADCQALHRTIMSAFPATTAPGAARDALGVLYRPEIHPRTGAVTVLVQSTDRPDWSGLRRANYLLPGNGERENPACKSIADHYATLQPGMVLRFRLRANPTKRLATPIGPDGMRRPGKRVELQGEAEQLTWLERKSVAGGFSVLRARAAAAVPNVAVGTGQKQLGYQQRQERDTRHKLTFGAVVFDGLLRITDAALFRQTLRRGVGSGKAYGFGLLSIAPA